MFDKHSDIELSTAEKTHIEIRATEMLINVGIFTSIMHVAVIVLLSVVMWPAANTRLILLWAITTSLGVIFQGFTNHRYRGQNLSAAQSNSILKRYEISAIWVAVSWGAAGFFLFPEQDQARAFFLVFVIGGMSMSAVATQHMQLRMCLVAVFIGVLPIALRYSLSELPFNFVSAALLVMYTSVLTSIALRLHNFSKRTFMLQAQQQRLLGQLSEQTKSLERARNEADHANDAKSRFLAEASHDLRQPLHAISLFMDSLPHAQNKAEHDFILKRVRQSLDVLTKLFDSLLDVTLIDTGGIEVKQTIFRPTDIIDEIVRDFDGIAEAANVDLRTVSSDIAVHSDPVLIRRMLQNLVSNAIRYSEEERVLIGCRRRNGGLSIAVIDTGSGINEYAQAEVFNEFKRLDNARMGETSTPGLGLGLSIVKRIADELNLSISLSSKIGRGSVFEINGLEISKTSPSEPTKNLTTNNQTLPVSSVFVLDDDIETLEATAMLLTRWGCNVETSQNWQDLLNASPDIIICDYEISPKKSGLDILAELKAKTGQHVPAIMISGHTSHDLREQTRELNIPLLHKPLRPAQLRSALLNAMASSPKSS